MSAPIKKLRPGLDDAGAARGPGAGRRAGMGACGPGIGSRTLASASGPGVDSAGEATGGEFLGGPVLPGRDPHPLGGAWRMTEGRGGDRRVARGPS